MPSKAYWFVVGKLFEDLEFLQKLKIAQLRREEQFEGRKDAAKWKMIGSDFKRLIKARYNVTLNESDVKLLFEQKGDRKLNLLDTIFSARVELGTGPKSYP
jgi:hypothetical protein